MDSTKALERVKTRLHIAASNTDFDADINDYVESAVNRLYPMVTKLMDTREVTLTSNSQTVELQSGAEGVSFIEIIQDGEYDFYEEYSLVGRKIRFDNSQTSGRKFAITEYTRHTYAAITDIPAEYELVVVYWAMSEFYEFLAGNKRKYSVYMNSAGTNAVDNMQDMVDRLEERANDILGDRFEMGGHQ